MSSSVGDLFASIRASLVSIPDDSISALADRIANDTLPNLRSTVQGTLSYELALSVSHLNNAVRELKQAGLHFKEAKRSAEVYIVKIGGSGAPVSPPVNRGILAVVAEHRGHPRSLSDQEQQLVEEVRRNGHGINDDRISRIGRNARGEVIWIENGNPKAGVAHIMEPERVSQFERFGVDRDDIIDLAFRAATRGEPIGIQGVNRTVFEVQYRGQCKRVAVSVLKDGLIIGANPVSVKAKVKPLP